MQANVFAIVHSVKAKVANERRLLTVCLCAVNTFDQFFVSVSQHFLCEFLEQYRRHGIVMGNDNQSLQYPHSDSGWPEGRICQGLWIDRSYSPTTEEIRCRYIGLGLLESLMILLTLVLHCTVQRRCLEGVVGYSSSTSADRKPSLSGCSRWCTYRYYGVCGETINFLKCLMQYSLCHVFLTTVSVLHNQVRSLVISTPIYVKLSTLPIGTSTAFNALLQEYVV